VSYVAYLAIVATVWTVILLPEGRLRGFVYALPIPMSIALLGTAASATGTGTQLLGVPLLVVFFLVVALVEDRVGRLAAVIVGVLVVVACGAALHRWVTLTWPQAYGVAAALWLLGGVGVRPLLARWPHTPRTARPAPALPSRLRSLVSVLVAAGVSFALGSWLGPFVVTFPYSGVPVALLLTRNPRDFTADFAWRSGVLTVFLAAHHEASQRMGPVEALAVGWVACLAATGLLVLVQGSRGPVARNP